MKGYLAAGGEPEHLTQRQRTSLYTSAWITAKLRERLTIWNLCYLKIQLWLCIKHPISPLSAVTLICWRIQSRNKTTLRLDSQRGIPWLRWVQKLGSVAELNIDAAIQSQTLATLGTRKSSIVYVLSWRHRQEMWSKSRWLKRSISTFMRP